MIRITDTLAITEKDVEERFLRAMGPGGQNARNEETAVQLRYDVARSSLPPEMKRRIVALACRRLTAEGVLVIDSRAHPSQEQNRAAARQRLVELLQRAAQIPIERRTRRSGAMDTEIRMTAKKQRGAIKQLRARPDAE